MSEQARKSGRRILKSGAWLFLPKTASAVLSLLYLALATQTLGPESFGKFMLIFSFAQMISGFATFQTWQILIRYGTELVHSKSHDRVAELTWICLILDLAGVLLALLLGLVGSALLAHNQGWVGSEQYVTAGFTVLLVLASRSTATGLLRINDRFSDAALPDTLVPVIRLIGTLILVATGPTMFGFLMVWLLSELIPAFVIWLIVWRRLTLPMKLQSISGLLNFEQTFPGIGKFALWSNVGSSFKLTSQQMVVVAVGYYVGATAAGFFRLGYQLGQVFARVGDALSLAIFTEYAHVAHSGEDREARGLLLRTMKLTIVAAISVLGIIWLTGKSVIVWIFGTDFLPAYPLMLILGAGAAVQFAVIGLEPALLTAGKAGRVMVCSFAGAVTIALLLIWLMPAHGASGAACAVLGAAIVNALSLIISYRQKILKRLV
jgi:O-antigen/teichoic acid export membrane protein